MVETSCGYAHIFGYDHKLGSCFFVLIESCCRVCLEPSPKLKVWLHFNKVDASGAQCNILFPVPVSALNHGWETQGSLVCSRAEVPLLSSGSTPTNS